MNKIKKIFPFNNYQVFHILVLGYFIQRSCRMVNYPRNLCRTTKESIWFGITRFNLLPWQITWNSKKVETRSGFTQQFSNFSGLQLYRNKTHFPGLTQHFWFGKSEVGPRTWISDKSLVNADVDRCEPHFE